MTAAKTCDPLCMYCSDWFLFQRHLNSPMRVTFLHYSIDFFEASDKLHILLCSCRYDSFIGYPESWNQSSKMGSMKMCIRAIYPQFDVTELKNLLQLVYIRVSHPLYESISTYQPISQLLASNDKPPHLYSGLFTIDISVDNCINFFANIFSSPNTLSEIPFIKTDELELLNGFQMNLWLFRRKFH